jgi:hypothetical protein
MGVEVGCIVCIFFVDSLTIDLLYLPLVQHSELWNSEQILCLALYIHKESGHENIYFFSDASWIYIN